ncbi:MAG: hypothetical protein BM556_07275 [Bacteriovorax sp. MedPE-SWde]|nr:MAG: hypothetical protein BM556_07275 [Bacteriovorax sp. MedPE-SWde]
MNKFILVIFSLFLITCGYIVSLVPVTDILKLKNGYVLKSYDKEKGITYTVVDKKPRSWIKLNRIEKKSYSAIVISEDWSFYTHDGVDFNQLTEALEDTLKGKRVRGASTISQQVVKNLFTNGERTISRKIRELLGTLFLEKQLSKDKILETYLNVIQYGDGLYGITNASQFYFKKNASKLSVKESAFLAMLLPSPVRYSQSFREKKLTDYAENTVNTILDKLAVAKYITKNEAVKLKNIRLSFEKSLEFQDLVDYFDSL